MAVDMDKWRGMDGSDGFVCQPFIHIVFQRGSVVEHGINGCRLEDVIDVLIERLLDHQGRDMACKENEVALHHLQVAKEALLVRRRVREQQHVINTRQKHASMPDEDLGHAIRSDLYGLPTDPVTSGS
ncbi:MAG: hypothetical protein KIT11_08390 [Fimbriimonadaceae bacterium]|nr:hypothetical protein [Fimbriimonadaceae bacterium]QYK56371.1 MAG: hypothetical protein KF733_02585 [Fimbriimonadaceae bacterium]